MRARLLGTVAVMAEERNAPSGSGAGGNPDAGQSSDEARRDGAEWGERAKSEPRWPAMMAIAASIALYFAFPTG